MQTNQPPTDTSTFAGLLRDHRRAAGLTQAALAELAGLSEQAIGVIERGTRQHPRRETVDALSRALRLDIDETDALRRAARSRNGRPNPAVPSTELPDVPREVPSAPPDFTGRNDELHRLVTALSERSETPDAVRILAVSGMGGVGKTALAIRAAHLAADSFPDGQLYIDLRGYGPGASVQPLPAASRLLRSLGLRGSVIPDDLDGASALLRTCLAGRRLLLILDNANSVEQIMPLLPGAPGSVVLVTSRRALVTIPGCIQVSLQPLAEQDAVELLSSVAGAQRISAAGDDARHIARLTGNLPLAVRLVGARLAARPSWPVAHMVEQLRDERERLNQLGSGESGVRASIAGSLEFLASSNSSVDRRAAEAVDYLGLLNGSELISLTAARLLDVPASEAEQALERLVDLNLLESMAPGRYRLHDLVLTFARERGLANLSAQVQAAALDRLLRLYIDVSWSCQRLTHHHSRRLELAGPAVADPVVFATAEAALAWLDDQQANLSEVLDQARESEALRIHLPELALALFGYHEARSRWALMRSVISTAQEVVRNDQQALAAWLEHDRAIPDIEQNDLAAGEVHLREALRRFEELDDPVGQARCCSSIGYVSSIADRLDECLSWTGRTLELSRGIEDPAVEGLAHLIRGTAYTKQGRHDQAKQSFELSIHFRGAGLNRRSLAKRYGMIGHAYLSAGRLDDAADALHQSLQTFAALGDEGGQSETLLRLASLELERRNLPAAARCATAGLQHGRRSADKYRESQLLLVLGKVEYARGRLEEARTRWQQAATLLHAYAPHAESEAAGLLATTAVRQSG